LCRQSVSSPKAETECRHGIDLKNPFTMSKKLASQSTRCPAETGQTIVFITWICRAPLPELVEPVGIEPTTSSLQS
jgi:hypothetical protein